MNEFNHVEPSELFAAVDPEELTAVGGGDDWKYHMSTFVKGVWLMANGVDPTYQEGVNGVMSKTGTPAGMK